MDSERATRLGNQVSIPFIAGQWSLQVPSLMWEALYCYVSIPFIAGQWSLLNAISDRVAVAYNVSIPFIAGQWSLRSPHGGRDGKQRHVSIPFIAGQWSLHPDVAWSSLSDDVFQSPSLRGSGRFKLASYWDGSPFGRFNPLHFGAVVASRVYIEGRLQTRRFQSPSLRGSGRFGWGVAHSD